MHLFFFFYFSVIPLERKISVCIFVFCLLLCAQNHSPKPFTFLPSSPVMTAGFPAEQRECLTPVVVFLTKGFARFTLFPPSAIACIFLNESPLLTPAHGGWGVGLEGKGWTLKKFFFIFMSFFTIDSSLVQYFQCLPNPVESGHSSQTVHLLEI